MTMRAIFLDSMAVYKHISLSSCLVFACLIFQREIIQYATYVPCAAHPLNLIGTSAAECYSKAISACIFTASPGRAKLLQKILTMPENVTLKSLSHTCRLSDVSDVACTSLNRDWNQVTAALKTLTKNPLLKKF